MPLTFVLFEKKQFRYILMICLLAMSVAVAMYAYLGVFSRYLADDYCEAVRMERASPLAAVIERYAAGATRASNRYSNLLFVGLSEMLGPHNMQITIVAMVALWVLGLSLCARALRRLWQVAWFPALDFFWGTMLGFFSLFLAPNLFQSVHWRSAMMTHFAPLVFGSFLAAYALSQFRKLRVNAPSWWARAIAFLGAFIVAGFSEPPVTTMITALPMWMGAVWFLGKSPVKQKQLALLAWMFAGAFLGFLVLVFSPASFNVAESQQKSIMLVLGGSFRYSYLFIIESLRAIPLPAFLAILLPWLLIWLYQQADPTPRRRNQISVLWLGVMVIPVLIWVLIAAGFAPSVYGQNYPVERTRFLGRTILIMALMAEGILFGCLSKDLRLRFHSALGQWAVLILFAALAAIYPLRAAYHVYEFDVPEYRTHAEQWDVRDAQIRAAVAAGATDLAVQQLDSMRGVVEYKGNPRFWVNGCAARFYGLNSLVAP